MHDISIVPTSQEARLYQFTPFEHKHTTYVPHNVNTYSYSQTI